MERKDRLVWKTAWAMLVLLLFFFAQGAIVVIGKIEGISSILIRGGVIWGLVALTLAYYIIRYKEISKLGFRSMERGAAKRMLYFSPLLLIALSPFAAGVNYNGGAALILANLFLTLGIGMAEEIFFRGIICGAWLGRGTVYRIAGLFPLSVTTNCLQKGTGYERQVKTDEKVSGHVLRGGCDQPAGGAVALYRAVDVWLGFLYPL